MASKLQSKSSSRSKKGKVPADLEVQEQLKSEGPLPRHVAVIMDGNGRWAAERGKPRVFGHRAGVESVRDTVRACGELGIEYLTLYTFSTENWQRPRTEVDALMQLLVHTTRREVAELLDSNVQLNAIGDLEALPEAARRELSDAIEITSVNDGLVLTLAISYSGRWEIVRAARHLARKVLEGSLDILEVDEDRFSASLTTSDMPDPDLLVRTGGELRISNFLLWQLAYAEIFVTPTYWPDFRRDSLYEAIRSFHDRERRFGRVSPSDR
jgi:undecaprenyl diphosphate synthase